MKPRSTSTAALLTLSIATFAFVTTESLPIGLLTLISGSLGASVSQVGLLVTVYAGVVVLTSIPLTHATRHISRRTLLSALLGVFAFATVASALAPTYQLLLASRIVTALSQALFWSIVVPAAANLAPAATRGRAIALVFAGSSLAAVAGVPVGAWLGEWSGWRSAFLALAMLGFACCLAIAALLPGQSSDRRVAHRGEEPSAIRYGLLVFTTVLATTGAFAGFTYVVPFLRDVDGFSLGAIGPLLLIRGLAGLAGVFIGGRWVDRDPWTATVYAVGLQTVALAGLFAFGQIQLASITLLALSGLSFAALTSVLGGRVMQVAPMSVDLAASGTSTAVNLGIAGGAFIGGAVLPVLGVRPVVLVAAALSLAGLVSALAEPLLTRRPGIPGDLEINR